MKQISSFMSEISDEFKIVVVEAIQTLCPKFPRKHNSLMSFLAGMLREEVSDCVCKAHVCPCVYMCVHAGGTYVCLLYVKIGWQDSLYLKISLFSCVSHIYSVPHTQVYVRMYVRTYTPMILNHLAVGYVKFSQMYLCTVHS